ncbi:MAG: hypothetical protein V4599_02315 [Verrucomicrobiota bacterium]
MSTNESKSLDLLGVKPIGDAVKIATDSTFKGAGEFLSRICLPAAEEFGLLLRDRVSHWRATQAAKIIKQAEAKVSRFATGAVHAHPRLVFEVIEQGSWSDDDAFQDTWAGLLASSCTEDGQDDSNVIFASLLSQLTGIQLRILNHSVEASPKYSTESGLPYADTITLSLANLTEISKCSDTQRLDRELDHLRSLELIGAGGIFGGGGGFPIKGTLDASIRVSPLAMHLYVRGQGFIGSPIEFFGLTLKPENQSTPTDVTKA